MKELDLLKKAWNKDSQSFHQVTENEIYIMIQKKSSSLVKWILIIGILEFLFWASLGLFSNTEESLKKIHAENLYSFYLIMNIINFGIILWFIYLFYKNYNQISVIASTKELMQNILKTRKTVKYYVGYNLGIIGFNLILNFGLKLFYNPKFQSVKEEIFTNLNFEVISKTLGQLIIMLSLSIGMFWLFYKLLYGFFMKKLIRNYKELEKMDD